MPPPPSRKRSAIDTLVARDHTAVFWFLVACLTAGLCAWYVTRLSNLLAQRPDFVVMDTSGAYYVPPGKLYNQMPRMHLELSEYAAETLLTRNREGLQYMDRLPKLCLPSGMKAVEKYLAVEGADFFSQQIEQVPLIQETKIVKQLNTILQSQVTGEVSRRGIFKGKEQTERYRFTLVMVWRQNLLIAKNHAFPSRIENMDVKLEKITEL